jgi:putative endonuclease
MYHVYLLNSLGNPNKSYVGLTIKPLKVRLKEHNDGLSTYTKTNRPWRLIYFEQFYCKICADKREQFLKSGFGYRLRKILLANSKDLR